MKKGKKLNGSADLLSKAMRQVFDEAVQPLRDDIKRLDSDMKAGFEAVNEDIRRVEGDMQNGFAELRPPK